MNDQFKHAVTIAEMARMVGLSRSRFYQLIGKAFPDPCRDESGKPFYGEEQQRMILDVRRRNCGIDGKPILFYAPRHSAPSPIKKRRPKNSEVQEGHAAITEGVKALGLPMAASGQGWHCEACKRDACQEGPSVRARMLIRAADFAASVC